MDYLHAYWRMEYVEAPKDDTTEANPFLKLPHNPDDRSTLIVHRSVHNYIVLNRYPYNAGHLLVIPYREVPQLHALQPEERTDHFDMLLHAQHILQEALRPEGFNIGYNLGMAAGAGIPRHLHAHVIPRWTGDSNFMPVIGKTRVLAQSLTHMWERLHEVARTL